MLDFLALVEKFVTGFHVRANADKPRDAALARTFGAHGIGLVRTEHMFFDEKRINLFREMILSDTVEDRRKALAKLQPMQKADFYKLFKIMEDYPVIIRLLDAPLHEFLPHNDQEMERFMRYLNAGRKGAKRLAQKDVQARCDALHEFNPMLGHRGCRIAVSYPEIYEMQVRAIFEAVYTLKKEGVKVEPEIMIPIIMNENELKLIIYGKKIEGKHIRGLVDVERDVRESFKAKPASYKIGTMVELPAAALGAGELARYAQFFSFGTNDLTQTTIGLSRDDFNTFMPDYTQFDLLEGNPFQYLNPQVKELIALAVTSGKMTRPDLEVGPVRRARRHPREHPLLHGGGAGLRLLLALPGAAVEAGHCAAHDREEEREEEVVKPGRTDARQMTGAPRGRPCFLFPRAGSAGASEPDCSSFFSAAAFARNFSAKSVFPVLRYTMPRLRCARQLFGEAEIARRKVDAAFSRSPSWYCSTPRMSIRERLSPCAFAKATMKAHGGFPAAELVQAVHGALCVLLVARVRAQQVPEEQQGVRVPARAPVAQGEKGLELFALRLAGEQPCGLLGRLGKGMPREQEAEEALAGRSVTGPQGEVATGDIGLVRLSAAGIRTLRPAVSESAGSSCSSFRVRRSHPSASSGSPART